MKDKLFQFSLFAIVTLISSFAILNIVDFIYICIVSLFLGIAIFDIKTSIIITIIARDFILKSYFYYTGHVLNISHVIFYHLVVLLLILMLVFREKKRYHFELFNSTLILFVIYLAFSTFFISNYRGYGIEKLFYFALTLLGCFAISNIILKPKDVKFFAMASFYQGLFFVLVCIVSEFDYKLFNGTFSKSRFSLLAINPIWVSRLLFYGLLSNIYVFKNSKNRLLKLGLIIASIFQFYYGFLTGSRGPIVALIIGVILYSFSFLKKVSLSKIMIVLLFFAIIIGIGFSSMINDPNSRFAGSGTGDSSTQAKIGRAHV